MTKSADVQLLDGESRNVELDKCTPLAITGKSIAMLGLDFLAARLTESHRRPRPTPDQGARVAEPHPEQYLGPLREWCDIIPRAIYRDPFGLPFAEVVIRGVHGALVRPTIGANLDRAAFLEIPRETLAEFLERSKFDKATIAEWAAPPGPESVEPTEHPKSEPADPPPIGTPKPKRKIHLKNSCMEIIQDCLDRGDTPPTPKKLAAMMAAKGYPCSSRPGQDAWTAIREENPHVEGYGNRRRNRSG